MLLSALCVIPVVYHHLMFCRCMLSCTGMCVSASPRVDPFLFWLCRFLSAGTWYPDPPCEGPVEAAISTQRCPQTAERPFILHSAAFFLKSTFLTHPPFKPNCLICILPITSQQAPATWHRARFHPPVIPFALKTCRRGSGKAFRGTVHSDFTAHFDNNWHETWATTQSQCLTYISFFSFFMSFREGALRCLLCSGRPFCLWKSQWGRSWEAPFKTFTRHRSAAPLAK